jgi:hypothetical protein
MNDEEKQGKSWLLEFLTGVIFLEVAMISNSAGWLLAAAAAREAQRFVAL